jgi:spermidine synthase
MTWHPAPRRALLLGVGTGISFGAAASDPSLTAMGVELLPEVLALQGWFRPHNEAVHGSRVIAADARRYLRQSHERFDLIVGDLFHPSRDGAGALYTREQFVAMRDHLAPGGIAVQWLPLYQLDGRVLRSIIGAFLAAFPEAQGFLLRPNVDTPVLGLAAKNGVWTVRETEFATRVGSGDALRRRLQAAGLSSAESVWGCWLAGPKSLTAFAAGGLISTEDFPSVMFQAPKLGTSGSAPPGALLLELIDRFAGEGSEFPLAEPGGSWGRRLAAFRSARDEYLRGLAEEDRGDKISAEAALLRSVRLSPDFTLGYSQLLTRAMLRSKTDPSGTRRVLESLRDARPDQPVANQLLNRLEAAERPPPTP